MPNKCKIFSSAAFGGRGKNLAGVFLTFLKGKALQKSQKNTLFPFFGSEAAEKGGILFCLTSKQKK